MPARPPIDLQRGPVTPFGTQGASGTADTANAPTATRPIHWGDTPGGALVVPAESPRALYAVTRNWQGQQVALDPQGDAPKTQAKQPAREVKPTAAPATAGSGMELTARYLGQGSLCVRSSATGRHYRFTGHGHTLRVDKHDQMLMRRVNDVELI